MQMPLEQIVADRRRRRSALCHSARGVKWLHLSAHKVSQMLNLCVLCITIRSLPLAVALAVALLPFAFEWPHKNLTDRRGQLDV